MKKSDTASKKQSQKIAEIIEEILEYQPNINPISPKKPEEFFDFSRQSKINNSFKNVIDQETELGDSMDKFKAYLPEVDVVIIPEKHGDTETSEKIKQLTKQGKVLVSLEFDEGRFEECKQQLESGEKDTHDYMRKAAVTLVETVEAECGYGNGKRNEWIYADTDNPRLEMAGKKEPDDQWLTRRNFHMVCMIYRKLMDEFSAELEYGGGKNPISLLVVHIGENHNESTKCHNNGTIKNFLVRFGFAESKITVS